MLRRLSPFLLLLVGACVAGFMGYQRGFESVPQEKESKPDGKRAMNRGMEERRETRSDKMNRLKELSGRNENSHAAMIESWRIIRTFSLDEIHQALAEMPSSDERTLAGGPTRPMLYSRWAEIDPQAALDSLANGFADSPSFEAAFTTWMNRDPEAAYFWAKSKPELADHKSLYNRLMARSMSRETLAKALNNAAPGNDELREAVTETLATKMNAIPEERAAFLAELAKRGPEELAAGKIRLLSAWGGNDPQGALEGMDALGLPPPDAKSKRESILSFWARRNPEAALAWMDGKTDVLSLGRRTQIFNRWAEEDSAAALAHFDTLGKEPGFTKSVMSALLLEHGQNILNPSGESDLWIKSNRLKMQDYFRHWTVQAPEAAARWRDALDPALSKEIEP